MTDDDVLQRLGKNLPELVEALAVVYSQHADKYGRRGLSHCDCEPCRRFGESACECALCKVFNRFIGQSLCEEARAQANKPKKGKA